MFDHVHVERSAVEQDKIWRKSLPAIRARLPGHVGNMKLFDDIVADIVPVGSGRMTPSSCGSNMN